MEPAFENAGKVAGLEIWRIEDFKPVPYPKNDYGKFYSGDSYIVLNTKGTNGSEGWDLHFWLGSETSQDEAGTAAILSVQLDELLGGGPVQHREVEEHESSSFVSLFKNGVRYMPGGVASGFTTVDRNNHEKRMYHVKGRRNVRVKQVTPKISSMNKGDCFILDLGTKIYVFQGEASQKAEQIKANQAANFIRDQDHGGRPDVKIIDPYSDRDDYNEFFSALGEGSKSAVPEAETGGDDTEIERVSTTATLYKISDATGTLTFDTVASTPLSFSTLDTNDCFLIDTGSGIFVWVGKKSNVNEKKQAMNKAQEFVREKNYPTWTQIQRVMEGYENGAFKQYVK